MYCYYDKILLTADFDVEIHENYLKSFLYQHEHVSLVKSISNPICIDLFLTKTHFFKKTLKTVSTVLSEFYKLVLTVLKTSIVIINCN